MSHHDAQKLKINGDLNETMFLDATIQGKIMPSEAIIVATMANATHAIELAQKYHARAVLVSEGLMAGFDHWFIIGPNGSVWSPGA